MANKFMSWVSSTSSKGLDVMHQNWIDPPLFPAGTIGKAAGVAFYGQTVFSSRLSCFSLQFQSHPEN